MSRAREDLTNTINAVIGYCYALRHELNELEDAVKIVRAQLQDDATDATDTTMSRGE